MRVLLVDSYDLADPGGVTSYVIEIARHFHKIGHEVTVAGPAGKGALPQNSYTHHLAQTFRWMLTTGDSARINLNPFVIRPVREFLAERRFDVIHLQEPFLGFLGPAFLRLGNAVKVATFHASREGLHVPYAVFRPLIQHWDRRLQGRVAVSEAARKTIKRYVPGEYRIIPSGVDFERFASRHFPPPALADREPTVLFVGRVEPRKGIPYLLEAFASVKRRVSRARLVIVGEGRLRSRYTNMATRLGLKDVSFEGSVAPELLPAYYQRADVFCSPSTLNESFGLTLLEAMAAGAPAVATSVNGPTTLGLDGVNGLIVPPRDAPALADAIERLLEDREFALDMAAAAQARARLFDWKEIGTQLLAYYEELGAV